MHANAPCALLHFLLQVQLNLYYVPQTKERERACSLRKKNGFGALAEFERNLIRERTHAGLQAARARGRKGGRPKKLTADKAALAIQLYTGRQHSIKQICDLVGVSKPTLYKYLKVQTLGL